MCKSLIQIHISLNGNRSFADVLNKPVNKLTYLSMIIMPMYIGIYTFRYDYIHRKLSEHFRNVHSYDFNIKNVSESPIINNKVGFAV